MPEKKKILFVEDNEGITKVVTLVLESTNRYEVRVEHKGKEVINAAREFKPDLILMEDVLPDLDGTEVASLLMKERDLKDIPIIFLTTRLIPKDSAEDSRIIGGYTFLMKPANTDRLIECMEQKLKATRRNSP